MVGRHNKIDPVNIIKGGFADPDPSLDGWQPPPDQVPMPGTGKDSRFLEDNMWATKPMRPKTRPNLGAYVTNWDASTAKPAPKLDGTSAWGDWGVKEPTSLPGNAKNDYYEGSPVPCTIDGMNQVLEQRARAASAQSAAAYARASPPAVVQAKKVTAPNSSSTSPSTYKNKFIPPHKRKLLGAHVPSPKPVTTPQTETATQATAVTVPSEMVDDDILALLQGMVKERNAPAKDQVEDQANLISARPSPGTHFTVPRDFDARKPSSTTPVSGASDDEMMAKQLQANEFGLVHMDHAQEMVRQELNHYMTAREKTPPSPSGIKEAALYTRLHKVHEVLWKQEMMNLAAFAKPKDDLFNMGEEFNTYYDKVVSMHLAQWNCGASNKVFGKERNVSAVGSSSSSDRQFILAEDDLNSLEDIGEHDFDSDGFGVSGDEDEDDGPVVFKGRG